ncbi:aryl-alcohol dehydrogenase-like predicted oxidoreductase [Catenuloplanes nepalensis]|uniref:Aryl-alcohol dehydrogenase-like predicted oxidoreductase n=1 Tax=Catenuloplanes nepalensis TaxID=587533 RepID=A0ABT9MQ97_9ACTN|nr:aldo/keto reductase [Catenuloplanes nepalensis]MDP9793590.1 aryl-alcohol dehydrogenase-like predicted oxidoreductase [Catenuloplanes nepalensis]
MSETLLSAKPSGTYAIGGDLPVVRLGYGTMQLTGPGVWGDPADPDEALRVLRRTADLGITLIDTADAYGPYTADLLLRKALHPYRGDLVIATKVGHSRQGPNVWTPLGRPEYLRQQTELNLRNLGLERIPLLQLHRVDPKVPLEDQIGELDALRKEGKVQHIGLSEVSVAQLEAARAITSIVAVQNRYNVADRASEDVLDYAEANDIAFIPWHPLATGRLARPGGPLDEPSTRLGVTPSQLALAWLLRRSPVMLPIPGTSSVGHLEQNVAAAQIVLSDDDFATLSKA